MLYALTIKKVISKTTPTEGMGYRGNLSAASTRKVGSQRISSKGNKSSNRSISLFKIQR